MRRSEKALLRDMAAGRKCAISSMPVAGELDPSREVICHQATYEARGVLRKGGPRKELTLFDAAQYYYNTRGIACCRTCDHKQSCATIKGANQ